MPLILLFIYSGLLAFELAQIITKYAKASASMKIFCHQNFNTTVMNEKIQGSLLLLNK